MRKIYHLIVLLLLATNALGQIDSIRMETRSIKVRPIKTIDCGFGEENEVKDKAVVLEFDVLTSTDQKVFGKKLYAIVPCVEFPVNKVFQDQQEWDLTISEKQYYQWKFKILNEELLEKNIDKKKYWAIDISRGIPIHCYIRE